ncbi:ABC transporter permease [Paenibacillus oleatilyticus]|uniref:Transport permease protein n=1 Tax=Paenibacillus oleatilyticus TaxID=2594886 RepID=A0ABV4V6Y1_9BACL
MVSIINLLRILQKNRELIQQFIKREVITKYKGSYLGVLWSIITPLIMLSIYTYVFGVIFKSKWDFAISSSKQEFAITVFCGMIVFSIFSETITKSPSVITNNPNYVKKVVFPLEILPVSLLGGAIVNFCIGVTILLIGKIAFIGNIGWTLLYLPVIILPLLLFSLGLAYIFASLGVFLRDLEHTIGIAVQALYLLTPIFYPLSAIPENLRNVILINPIAGIVDNMRKIVIWGIEPDMTLWGYQLIGSIILLQIGYWWFMKLRKGFADVI